MVDPYVERLRLVQEHLQRVIVKYCGPITDHMNSVHDTQRALDFDAVVTALDALCSDANCPIRSLQWLLTVPPISEEWLARQRVETEKYLAQQSSETVTCR